MIRLTKEERERQIVESAKRVFIEKGYAGATTIELAREANISEVTLFRYFPTKRDLFRAAIDPLMVESLDSFISDKDLSPEEILRLFLQDRIEFIIKNADIIKLVLIEGEMNNELFNQISVVEKITDKLQSVVDRFYLNKEVDTFLLRMIIGNFLSFLFFPKKNEENVEKYVDHFMDYLNNFLYTSNK